CCARQIRTPWQGTFFENAGEGGERAFLTPSQEKNRLKREEWNPRNVLAKLRTCLSCKVVAF
ncbi:MAG TPA: hypothetical protein VIJ46_04325, partial [Rhabdochlamydiaceae bacterium]